MNTDTGEIKRLVEKASLLDDGFVPVPIKHAHEAEAILDGKESAYADMTKDTPLVRWAIQNTQRKKASNRKAMQKESKRKNRR